MDRALRGMQIGAKSMESKDGIVFMERYTVHYECPNGHELEVLLSVEIVPPANWEHRYGAKEELIDEAPEDEEVKPVKSTRTRQDTFYERRSLGELEVILNKRLTLFREGRLRPKGHYRRG